MPEQPEPMPPGTLREAIEVAIASCDRGQAVVPLVTEAVVDYLSEMTDEIEGTELRLPGTRVWLHTKGQVNAWLDREGAR